MNSPRGIAELPRSHHPQGKFTIQGRTTSPEPHMSQGKYPFPFKQGVVPGSDGAGTVEAVGSRVTRFKPGGRFLTWSNTGSW